MGRDWRDIILSGLSAMLVTGAAAWFSFGTGVVSDAEMDKLEASLKQHVEVRLKHERELMDRQAELISANTAAFNRLSEAFEGYRREQAELNGRLRTFLEEN